MSINVQHRDKSYTGPATISGKTLHFKDGKAEAKEGTNLTAFRRAGYKLSRGASAGLDDLTIPQLREHAEKHGIDLEGASKKAEIINAISATPTETPAEDTASK